LGELKIDPVDEKLRRYKSNWLRHKNIEQLEDAKSNVEL